MQQDVEMTKGSLTRGIIALSIPLMITNVLQILFNMADVAVVGRFVGSLALGAVGSTALIDMVFVSLQIGIGGGINVLAAREIGAGNQREVEDLVHTAFLISLICGLVLMIAGYGSTRGMLELIHTRPELIDQAELYLHIIFLGMPGLAIYNYGNAILSAGGNTRSPLIYLTVSGILNVILNLFFVLVLGMTVDGVALASILTQYLSAFLIMHKLMTVERVYRFRLRDVRLNGFYVRSVLAIGIPTGLQNAVFMLANMFTQMAVNSFSAEMVAGNSAAGNLDALIFEIMAAIYTACASFMGQNYGAGQERRVKRSYWISVWFSCAVGTILGLIAVLFGPQLLGLFTNDAEVVRCGMQRVMMMDLFIGGSAFMDCTNAASRSLGKTVMPTVFILLGSCVFRIIWIYTVFASVHTIQSLYVLYPISWLITAAASMIYYFYTLHRVFPRGREAY